MKVLFISGEMKSIHECTLGAILIALRGGGGGLVGGVGVFEPVLLDGLVGDAEGFADLGEGDAVGSAFVDGGSDLVVDVG